MVAILKAVSGSSHNLQKIQVEVETLKGFPDFHILGLSSSDSSSLKLKFRSIIKNSGFKYPSLKKIVSFLPSNSDIYGVNYDVSVAIGFLVSTKQIKYTPSPADLFLGSLSLDGTSNYIEDLLGLIESAKRLGFQNIFVPKQNYSELCSVKGVNIIAYSSLFDLTSKLAKFDYPEPTFDTDYSDELNFDSIVDNLYAKRILSINIGSFSNVLLVGFPGVGKSLLLKSLPSIMPPPNKYFQKRSLDAYPILLADSTITKSDLVGQKSSKGLFQKANWGVLAINELPDLSKKVLDLMKGPIEEKEYIDKGVHIPCMFSLLATMNPCRCGYLNSTTHECRCNPHTQSNYINKIGVPFLDRFDSFIDLTNQNNPSIQRISEKTETQIATKLVSSLREYQSLNSIYIPNMSLSVLQKKIDEKAALLFNFISQKLTLSPRRQVKLLRLAFSIAITEGKESISSQNLYEAISYQNYYFQNVIKTK